MALEDRPMYTPAVAARLIGLAPGTLRAWERRYEALRADASRGGRSMYSESMVRRLRNLAALTERGFRIGDIVDLPEAEIVALLAGGDPLEIPATVLGGGSVDREGGVDVDELVSAALAAATHFDLVALHAVVDRAVVALGRLNLADGFLFPLVQITRARRAAGECRPVHETFLVSNLAAILATMLAVAGARRQGPTVVVTAPGREGVELGCLATSVHVAGCGYTPLFVGVGVPTEDVVEVVGRAHAAAVVMSIVLPSYDLAVLGEVSLLRRQLPPEIPLLVGGRMSDEMRSELSAAGVRVLTDMRSLSEALLAA